MRGSISVLVVCALHLFELPEKNMLTTPFSPAASWHAMPQESASNAIKGKKNCNPRSDLTPQSSARKGDVTGGCGYVVVAGGRTT